MTTKLDLFNQQYIIEREKLSPGDIVRLQLEVMEGDKKNKKKGKKSKNADEKDKIKIQIFKGTIIAIKHGKGINATFTVRGIIASTPVEKIFPLHSPLIKKIEIIKHSKVRRAKLYYLRHVSAKKSILKEKIKKK